MLRRIISWLMGADHVFTMTEAAQTDQRGGGRTGGWDDVEIIEQEPLKMWKWGGGVSEK